MNVSAALGVVVVFVGACGKGGSPPSSIRCPEGARHIGAPFPRDTEERCVNAAGHRHGPYRLWDKDGRVLVDCSYADDVADGYCSTSSYGGKGGEAGTFALGKREGEWKFWREDGVIRMTQTFRDGTKHGLETQFAPDGSVISYACYQRGTVIWAEDGRGMKRTCQPD